MNYKTASEILDDLCLEKTAISILGLGGTAAGAVTGAITGLHKKKKLETDLSKYLKTDQQLESEYEKAFGAKPSPEQLENARQRNYHETYNKARYYPLRNALTGAGVGYGLGEAGASIIDIVKEDKAFKDRLRRARKI